MSVKIIKSIKKLRIFLVGDFFLDEYLYGHVERYSPEAPVPVVKVNKKTNNLGGAGNVLKNLVNLGCKVSIYGRIGNDTAGKVIISKVKNKKINKNFLLIDKKVKTITKTRIINNNKQVVRVDDEVIQKQKKISIKIKKKLAKELKKSSILIISDYGKGMCTFEICKFLISEANKNNITIIVDPRKGYNDYEKYRFSNYITPNLNEMRLLFPKIKNKSKEIFICSKKIIKKYKISNVITTRSEKGISYTNGKKNININTIAKKIFDVSGAGDTVVSVFSVLIGIKENISFCLKIANLCAGKVISKKGTTPITNDEFKKILIK